MAHVTVQGTFANVLRNLSLHLGTPIANVNARTERLVRLAIRGMGANPDDPGAIWLGEPFQIWHSSLDEVHAGNPLHLALLLISIGIVLWKWRETSQRKAFWYAWGIIAASTLFCAMIRWQIWSSRYHLPIFALGSALTGLVLERYLSRTLGTAVCTLVLVYALPFALMNRTRSLVPWSRVEDIYHPRSVMYFFDQHEAIAPDYIAAAKAVRRSHCGNVAIDSYLKHPDPEIRHSPKSLFVYPLFALMHAADGVQSVWYTGVHNLTSRYAGQENHPAPCAVVCLDCANVTEKWAENQSVGGRASVFGYIVVFGAKGTIPNSGTNVAVSN